MPNGTNDRDHRPSPEALLAVAEQEGRGRLKIFLGAAPGVGKTYTMLEAAHVRKQEGVDLVVGVDVYTTVNIQHLESLNDAVAQITSIRVRETIPDRLLDDAAEIELVDLSPEELLQRLREGKVYVPDQAQRAIQRFFRLGNLTALRELALRRTAE